MRRLAFLLIAALVLARSAGPAAARRRQGLCRLRVSGRVCVGDEDGLATMLAVMIALAIMTITASGGRPEPTSDRGRGDPPADAARHRGKRPRASSPRRTVSWRSDCRRRPSCRRRSRGPCGQVVRAVLAAGRSQPDRRCRHGRRQAVGDVRFRQQRRTSTPACSSMASSTWRRHAPASHQRPLLGSGEGEHLAAVARWHVGVRPVQGCTLRRPLAGRAADGASEHAHRAVVPSGFNGKITNVSGINQNGSLDEGSHLGSGADR